MTTAILNKCTTEETQRSITTWLNKAESSKYFTPSPSNKDILPASSPSRSWCGSQVSEDGYLKSFKGLPGSQSDLTSCNNSSKGSEVATTKNEDGVPRQGASVLAGKYLLLPSKASGPNTGASKNCYDCMNILTREIFSCKILPRNSKGLAMMAAYHRLDESSAFVNEVVEAIMTSKMVYFIFPKNYGNVHSYVLASKKLSEAEAANIFKQMVKIVQHCHSKGVIIRDIKLGRFVFTDKERRTVKLESLEDVVILNDPNNDHLDDKHGCPNYVSPEKAEILKTNSKYPGKATDLWSLGIILYTMIAGRYPFNDSAYPRLLHKIRTSNISIPQGLSPSAASLIEALLNKSPSGRPSCHAILKHPFIKHHCVSSPAESSESETLPRSCSDSRPSSDDNEINSMSCQKALLLKRMLDQVVPNTFS